MKSILRCLCLLLITSSCATQIQPKDASLPAQNAPAIPNVQQEPIAPFLTDIRQFTFAGTRAGEGYFSPDGRYLVFQSEREKANPFYQIYLTNLTNGTTRRISPGQGKTTCSWIHPDNKHILFASTHADPQLQQKVAQEWEARKAPKTKYSWSFDDAFDIYQTDFNGSFYKNLTKSPGYDAEGSYSPDGKWIAFASNRTAFTAPMTEEEKKLFAQDASVMMDIYLMRADGSQVKRLTTEPGYDGGPFFSPDGKRITYRHFTVDGTTAEVFTMNVDGSDKRQLTQLKAMSWAPFYHPSGDYIIFTTNKLGYHNFELYMIDVDGKHDPVRVTDLPGFDGLPVFTPDGQSVLWSHTNERGEAQLFQGKWNDSLARQALGLMPRVPSLAAAASKNWVEYLASAHLAGRATGSPEEAEYMKALAKTFTALGLKTDLQNYQFTSGVELDSTQPNLLQISFNGQIENLATAKDWTPLSFSQTGKYSAAAAVFAGYGIVAPVSGTQVAYDSYAGLQVKDKWVVVFSGVPEDVGNERRYFLHGFAQISHKAMMARARGARGLIIVEDTLAHPTNLTLTYEGRGEDLGIPVVRLSPQIADRLFATAGTSRSDWTTKLSKGECDGLDLNKLTIAAEINLHLKKSAAQNVLALLKTPGATSTVVIGAHGDHLGLGEMGNSLSRDHNHQKGSKIHFGADDNASGVAGVLQIAADLTQQVKSGKLKLKQNILFAIWSGEEVGILGSNQFLKDTSGLKISAYLNLDMIGRYRNHVMIQGTGSAFEWKELVERLSTRSSLNIHTLEDPYLPSDALAFYMKGIPVLMAFTGAHAEYHTPKDTADLINYEGLTQIAEWMGNMAAILASSPKSLVTYQKVESTQRPDEKRSFRLYLGTVPDYSQDGKAGVVISGTSKDSPAEKAGLKAGDTIIELGGIKIKNLYDYVYCLQALKANQKVAMRIVRQGREKEVEITPVLK